MKVFASWSGENSKRIALILKDWIPNVLQNAEVYVSSQDISKGERWLNNVSVSLQDHDIGVSIVTADNYLKPWILFEAGAISKTLNGRLVPLLCGIDDIDVINHPLTHFQFVKANSEEDMLKLIFDLNTTSDAPLAEGRLRKVFAKFYPDFVSEYEQIDLSASSTEKRKPRPEILEDAILSLAKEMREIRGSLSQLSSDVSADTSSALFHKKLTINAPTRAKLASTLLDREVELMRKREFARQLKSEKLATDDLEDLLGDDK